VKHTLATLLALTMSAAPRAPRMLSLEGDLQGVHDPCIIRQGGTYYVFVTNGPPGNIMPIRCSPDLIHWKVCGHVFDKLPDWATREIPGARSAWAPDISFFNGKYHLYYAVSTFGSRNSAIGLATTPTLDGADPAYGWKDEGMVLRSHQGSDDWNAIDPNLFVEKKDRVWLTWGSFWGGIKMRRLDASTGKLSDADSTMYSLSPAGRGRRQSMGRWKRHFSFGMAATSIYSFHLTGAAAESTALTTWWWGARERLPGRIWTPRGSR
jgi:arabinan endo-1,5-alpha-L-arabinosidase